MYKLRGHHLFCLLGYRGMGYSKEYVENMTKLHQGLRNRPKTWIQIVKGPDQLCEKYPNDGEYHCQEMNIFERDAAILKKLGLYVGQVIRWEDIESRIRKHVTPSDVQIVCSTCSWKSYGYCEEGIQEMIEGLGLKEVK
ncbi:DUF1284 domain-containing protein [Falsibacillus pallidus]|uniref:DUF1284 domain-containing protein n=1 Tax=Falsibacillus pallidus TaxID=493781 RepID=A0A370G206_9BACI|nr:DUF1284 domain-containing protein [Falsibacillus pallidus]RDI36654.1 hypothetical protein DFR59_1278 [Falsibacillus pallidus]